MGVEDRSDHPGGAVPAKRLGRRSALRLLGATLTGVAVAGRAGSAAGSEPAVRPGPTGSAGSRFRPLATGETPAAFAAPDFAILQRLVDLIIPDTDTPGAAAAGVHWFLDDVARTDAELRTQLTSGVRRLDERAVRQHGHPFVGLAGPTQIEMLAAIDDTAGARPDGIADEDRRFFALLKARVIDAYYKSEIGQLTELEWVGHEFYDEFPGACTHADAVKHPRPSWPRSRS